MKKQNSPDAEQSMIDLALEILTEEEMKLVAGAEPKYCTRKIPSERVNREVPYETDMLW